MQKRTLAILLYLFDITICVILGLYEHVLVVLTYPLFAVISITCGFFATRITIGSRSDLQKYFHPDATNEHIVMPLVFLVLIAVPLIIWIFSPEFGLLLLSIWIEINLPLFLIFTSFLLGTILSLPKELESIDNFPEG